LSQSTFETTNFPGNFPLKPIQQATTKAPGFSMIRS
jgi:hypothetical protein